MRPDLFRSLLKTAGLGLAALVLSAGVLADPMSSRGESVYRLAGCENCHTDREHGGARLAGGRKLVTPLGTFYTPNITPDAATGIGRWREADLRRALREGKDPEGRHYYPSFPYPSYTRLSDADMHALWVYLRSLPAVHQANKAHALPWYLRFRPTLAIWKLLYFKAGPYQANTRKSAEWNQGAYLVNGAGHCGECHTPRNLLGGFVQGQFLAGSRNGPEGSLVPNITPDKQSGLGTWNVNDLTEYLATGNRPDGDCAGSLMAEVIDNSLKAQSRADLRAMATYLLDQPAVSNPVRKPKKQGKAKTDSDY